jgi:serine protease Do
MNKSTLLQRGLLILVTGVLIGLIISAGLNWTKTSQADSPQPALAELAQTPGLQNNPGITALEELSNAFATVAEQVNPSVVTIFTETVRRVPNNPFQEFFGDDFFDRYFGSPRDRGREYKQQGLGSGVIVSRDGVIVTNNHVVQGADDISIRLLNGKEYKAELKGTDERTDVAILQIDAENLASIKFGDSDETRVGEWVLAIGSPLSPELAHTVTSGIISAKGRSGIGIGNGYEDYIQTDAAINPGNSGGALTNLKGELIGINTAIATRTGGFMGIGFAIPSNLVEKIMNDILKTGKVSRGWLGVNIQNIDDAIAKTLKLNTKDGILINEVVEGGPAKKVGLRVQDVIIQVDNRKVRNTRELATRIGSTNPGTQVTLTIIREGEERQIEVVLGEFPEELDQSVASTEISDNLGIRVSNINQNLVEQFNLKVKNGGVVIVNVEQGSASNQAGLRAGDIILKINRKSVNNVSDYNKIIEDIKSGESVLFYIQRDEGKFFVAFAIPE